ncbi:MAG: serine/threonine-protein kinase [Myxococcota bacterium]
MTKSTAELRVIEGGQGPEPDSEPPTDKLIGQTIDGRYHIERVLGEGGMGLVYLARHAVLQKPLAIKVLRPDVSRDEEIITRFRQEAQSASAIGNEHIINISDFGTLPDRSTYFVMEFLDGSDLTEVIEQGPMVVARAVSIAKQLCRGLGAAHDAGIVHRDLKPDNIFLIKRGGTNDFVKVLDFGIAKVGGGTKRLTKAGQVFGTPHYMSPEQCAGKPIDSRTDIYSLGVILYEMTTGQVPFDADNLMGVLTKHMYEQPTPPHQLPPPVNVPPALEAVILKCLSKDRDNRYQTTAEMEADLRRVEDGTIPTAVEQAVERHSVTGVAARDTLNATATVQAARRKTLYRVLGVMGAIAAVLAIALVVVSLNDSTPSEPEVTLLGPPEGVEVSEPPVVEPTEPVEVLEPEEVVENVEETGSTTTRTVNITTDPDRVEVWRDGELLGNTPIELPRPEGEDRLEIVLRRARYAEQAVRISSLTAESVHITLERGRVRPIVDRRPPRSMQTATMMAETVMEEPPPVMVTMEPPVMMQRSIQTEVLDPWASGN